MRKAVILIFVLISSVSLNAQSNMSISGSVEWETQQIRAEVSLDMIRAGLRLPAGRTQGEALSNAGYLNLIRSSILPLRVDSSSTIGDLVERGELTLAEIDAFIRASNSSAPSFSTDMRRITSSHIITLANITSSLLRHTRPSQIIRTLNPVSSAAYTGIIIIAAEELPVHGMRSSALPVPCIFPKVWDSEMNLVYERNILENRDRTMVRYSAVPNIFNDAHPSGLSPQLREIVGERPLRIFARGVFGIAPTDLIIDRSDALLIISSDDNRRLLSQGKVVFILDDSVLRYDFNE